MPTKGLIALAGGSGGLLSGAGIHRRTAVGPVCFIPPQDPQLWSDLCTWDDARTWTDLDPGFY